MGSFDELLKETKKDYAEASKEIDEVINDNDEETVDLVPIEKNITETNFPVKTSSGTYLDKVKKRVKEQKKSIKKKEEPEPETDLEPEDQQRIKKNFFRRIHVRRREKKRIEGMEHNFMLDSQKMITAFGFMAIVFLFLMWQYNPGNQALTTIIFIVGAFLFIPLGAILGWVFLDPYMRCKIMRKMAKGRKNFGIVNFVGKGKKIISRIKNFDEDLIWIKNKCWALTKSGIYELDKNGEQATEKRALDPDSFVTLTDSVPTMFIDIDSMQPLTFQDTGREGISPEELGSVLKGWVDNQMAKVMFLKKTLDAYFLILILCAIASAFFGYQNNQEIMELKTMIQHLQEQVSMLQ